MRISKKKYFFVLFSSLIIALTCLTQITDAQFSTKENIAKLNKIKKSTDFNLLLPSEDISKEWVLEIKNPENESNKVNFVHLNYLDKTDTFLKVSITETKAKNDFKELDDYGETVKIKDMLGVFHALTPTEKEKDVQGGTLSWIQDGTVITIFSSRLSKEKLIEIASSMEKPK
ncbi:DUF4367 domain-containing protein [Peribacillus castrilensis]|uniref:DUF4367 domain-containing protein n=1 Tax=Bacillaceae TaxID=186817 RepID=UPI00069D8887|nr:MULTISPECIES: DUF4367 domain-containing protein [Bacillaceae]MCT1390108.1 DUF4367 domain-containing protein [Peribacillus frigoritolerans]PRA73803.1 DUF4367 domain-containing protein [Peribacillus simplex]